MESVVFIGWLFIMALALLGLGISDRSLGWFIGGLVTLFVAVYALRQSKKEMIQGRGTVSGKFMVNALLIMLASIMAMAFFFTTITP